MNGCIDNASLEGAVISGWFDGFAAGFVPLE